MRQQRIQSSGDAHLLVRVILRVSTDIGMAQRTRGGEDARAVDDHRPARLAQLFGSRMAAGRISAGCRPRRRSGWDFSREIVFLQNGILVFWKEPVIDSPGALSPAFVSSPLIFDPDNFLQTACILPLRTTPAGARCKSFAFQCQRTPPFREQSHFLSPRPRHRADRLPRLWQDHPA